MQVKPTKKKIGTEIWVKQVKIASKISLFGDFFKFDSLAFLEIAYNDNLQQYVTSSRSKTHENPWRKGCKFRENKPKSGPKLGFSPFFKVWFISFPENFVG